ncbi:P-loop containing nucleoside triphosphate hydrolase protein [Pseudomassariella vexata]|uniref:DNA repair protein RAD51 homolog 3 n=1 Tax=Pseudomassariella vexata TaxID=1141098 RepID=A0A1Y2E1Y0_9PEZI|nr:P-loop containing nucleoside triphosphate hydrolase protein [Pseudomassariella vexata]ORY65354.1 P-loop containing nucleoside triphosphate hydrolase protein [Pseudomassariella vexata]
MDSLPAHGTETPKADLASTHRLPTVSAADALEELRIDRTRFISTGLDALDQNLGGVTAGAADAVSCPRGIQKGQVVEVWGPPGSGKTAFGIQVAASALRNGGKVVWVDAFRSVCGTRILEIMEDADEGGDESNRKQLDSLLHFTCPSLAHFIALLCRPTASCIPEAASLLVVHSLSALLSQSFPRVQEARNGPKGARRLQVLQTIISSLQKLAATRDMAVVVLSQCATRMQPERGATLVPSINAGVWEHGIATRLVTFRDWIFKDGAASGAHSIAVQKLNGKSRRGRIGPTFCFDVQATGLVPIEYDDNQPSITLSSTPLPKRKLGETDFEIADSEDEDYGWENEDETEMPPNPVSNLHKHIPHLRSKRGLD